MKTAFKGFDKDLKCRGEQFRVGEIYSKNLEIKHPQPCTSDGYHYCNKLEEVFNHYADNGSNRFCEIQILGAYTDEQGKSTTASFKVLREISRYELDTLRSEKEIVKIEQRLNLDIVQEIQKRYPMFHVGGSVGLFLHGVRLKRWLNKDSSDLDMISPYFVLVEDPEGEEDIVQQLDGKASGNDFDETFLYNGVKVDYKIDPKQRYEVIEYKGFKYKVSSLLTIFEAKMRYALNAQSKHKDDVMEIISAGLAPKPTEQTNKTENPLFDVE